ncbi:MAG TPA: GNAT family N-acetyltransferase [Actinophytocola sp.]|uniref:GNAT family N-acetyltransferase n=1 Tax=Actinophytocola sp. TaxID=1872138 RepID=UPI002DDDA2DD|nr:GNAT family N-acetyltransferase [Actinophytocola sp.]HEV2783528.1 GNAT family N-acetyltransferase [Actinophytocola sp.]
MTDFDVRLVANAELRTAHDLFLGSLHVAPSSDQAWAIIQPALEERRAFGAFVGDRMIGTALSFGSSVGLPGGGALPMAAVTGVGVRADHTRRGVLTELMRTQLSAAAAAGEALAGLHASEAAIYGRFGYGVAVTSRTITVQAKRAELRREVPRGGEVRLLDVDEALSLLPGIYERVRGRRPGMMTRPASWWRMSYERRLRDKDEHGIVAVHTGPDGEDGFVAYSPYERQTASWTLDKTLRVRDLLGTPAAIADLWRYLLGVDLVEDVHAWLRPLDEPLEPMLVNQHCVRSELDDDLWLRLVDVPAALAARRYGQAEPVVLEVRDRVLPANSGRYRISPLGIERTDGSADLAMDVDVLAMLYLGGTRASALAGIGRIEVAEPAALPRADTLFASDVTAWCGTMF